MGLIKRSLKSNKHRIVAIYYILRILNLKAIALNVKIFFNIMPQYCEPIFHNNNRNIISVQFFIEL